MAHDLPAALQSALDRLLEGVSRKELARRAAAISEAYRSGRTSAGISSQADVLAYLVSRLPATFAAMDAALGEVRSRAPGFLPRSVLDVGAGPGTASWVALGCWPGLGAVTMLDSNRHFLDMAATLAGDVPPLRSAGPTLGDFARPGAALPAADLVVAGFCLSEIDEGRVPELVGRLWQACEGILVLVEPGTPAGFARIRSARAALASAGARMVAPCPHTEACPIVSPDWCHFSVRLPRRRDHMIAKDAVVPFEDEKFSYVAFARDDIGTSPASGRILAAPQMSKAGLNLRLCAPEGIVARRVPRRDRAAFARLRHVRWGDGVEPSET